MYVQSCRCVGLCSFKCVYDVLMAMHLQNAIIKVSGTFVDLLCTAVLFFLEQGLCTYMYGSINKLLL